MSDAPRFGWLTGATDDASRSARRKWAVVGSSGLLTGMGHGFVQVAVSALLKPIAAELEMSRAGVSSAISLGRLVGGATSLAAGHSVDRFGARVVVVAGTLVIALGLFLTALVTGPLGLYLSWGVVVSAGTAFAFTVAMDRTVVAHATSGRGVALAIRFTIVALVTTAQLPVIVWLITSFGWRSACSVWAVLLLCTLPLPLLLFETGAATRAGGAAPEPSMTLRDAMRTRGYWVIAFAYMSTAGTIAGVSVHAIPMLTDRGWTVAGAGGVVGLLILLSIPARLLTGFYSDRLPPFALPRVLGAVLVALSLTLFADAVLRSDGTVLTMMLAKGVATGVPTVMILMIAVAQFGQASMGAIQGSFMFLQVPGTMAGPIVAGWVHDTTGTYALAIAGFGAFLFAAGIALQFAIPRPR
ncbi:MFS transporter [Psychromarinibacter sp. C21-152]|uniref:MFS transporter n=1 Tax=Psychromarinibacter sediminicola TaxID=3033385 RepID=A0AAE3NNW2_9RHOB|nr:MFS transporter [Psychromarinibacter sediminicola]MDF0599292.1 MFS transporter [Psychromarinibacter sediminicola]